MLSKVTNSSAKFGTSRAQKLFDSNPAIIQIYDDLSRYIVYQTDLGVWTWDTQTNKIFPNLNKTIQIQIQGVRFIKSLNSFDQSNFFSKDKIRSWVIKLIQGQNHYTNVLGIGGESWVYYYWINATSYTMVSNHQTIIQDSQINVPYAKNVLVDYMTWDLSSLIDPKPDLIILNQSNIHTNVINQIAKLKNEFKLIIITCHLPDSKLHKLNKLFKIQCIKHFANIKSWICILHLSKKLKK
jgi:hypothetical protein